MRVSTRSIALHFLSEKVRQERNFTRRAEGRIRAHKPMTMKKSVEALLLSFQRKLESMLLKYWIPAFAGMTNLPIKRKNTFCNTKNFRRRPSAFTLIEIIVTIVVTAIAFTAMSVWIFNANLSSVDPIISTRAAELGQAYLEEILAKRFDENTASGGILRCDESGQPVCSSSFGAETGETRAIFDDVDDYHNLLDNGAINALGQARTNYADFRVSVTVVYAGTELGLGAANNRYAKRIDVSVQHTSAGQFVFSAYRGNF